MSVISIKPKFRFPMPGPFRQAEPVDAALPLVKHLEELRDRLIKCAIGVTATTVLSFVFIERLMSILLDLAGTHPVQAIDPTETFGTYLQVALTTGIGLAIPLLVYQILRFMSPGLKRNERRWLFVSLPFVAIAFLCGAAFCYYVVLPSALNFLLSFGDPRILKQVSLTKFVSFVSSFILAVGASFEMPIVVFLIAKLGIASHKKLASWRKYALLLSFIIAAVITPTPDPINQALVGVPLFLLYELGVQLSRFARKKQV
ncbi:MAG: twin-arginine translocase subunit TatC [Chloroflexia bacterium]